MLGKALTGTVHWLLLPPPTRSLFIPLPMLGSANAVVPRLQSPLLGRKPSFVQREPFHRRRWPKQLPSCGVAARRLPPQVLRGQSVLAGRCPSPLPWAHLRFLEVVFAPFNHLNKPRDGHPALEDWLETLDWAKHSLNLPVLTLRLVVATSAGSEPQGSREMRRAQGKEVLAVYNSIVYPLSGLGPTSDGGMARFYADLAWPKCGAGVTCNIEAFLAWVINQDRAERQRIATDQPTHFLLNPTDLSSFFVCSCASSTLHSNKCSSPPAWFETNVAA